jgi:hypothetical protein
MELDVFSCGTQHVWIVLELPQPAVAVEAEQRPDGARHVVMVDVLSRRLLADRAEAALAGEEMIRLGSRNSVAARQVICARAAHLVS